MHTFQTKILQWYKKTGRELPWRKTVKPYEILVSEMMLQQTQVERVIPKYLAFLEQFPTEKALAKAKTSEVIKSWQGLGFNRRAIRLQEIAQKIIELGTFPESEQELIKLKGIGPYTASAVASFAYNHDVVVLDTNIRRVFQRVFLGHVKEENEKLTKEFELLAEKHLPKGKSRDWHNALMDLGAGVCTAQAPKCEQCPVQELCSFTKILEQASKEEKGQLLFRTRVKNKQGTFKNSDRYYRGRILDTLREGTVEEKDLKDFKLEKKRLKKILEELEKDKLIQREGQSIRLPE